MSVLRIGNLTAIRTDPEMLDSESMIWLRRPDEVISVYLAIFCQFLQLA